MFGEKRKAQEMDTNTTAIVPVSNFVKTIFVLPSPKIINLNGHARNFVLGYCVRNHVLPAETIRVRKANEHLDKLDKSVLISL